MAAQVFFQSNLDATKRLSLDVDGLTTGQTRVLVVPDRSMALGSASDIYITTISGLTATHVQSALAEHQTAIAARLLTVGGTITGGIAFNSTTLAGLRLNNLTTAQRDAVASPAAGSLVWNTTTSRLSVHNGSAWTAGFARIEGDTFTGAVIGPSFAASGSGVTTLGNVGGGNFLSGRITGTDSATTHPTTTNLTRFGFNAGVGNTGNSVTAFGSNAALNNSGLNLTAIGFNSSQNNTGDSVTAIGVTAGLNNTGVNLVTAGVESGRDNTGSNCLFLGRSSGQNNTLNNRFEVKQSFSNAIPLLVGDFGNNRLGIGVANLSGSFNLEIAGSGGFTGNVSAPSVTLGTSGTLVGGVNLVQQRNAANAQRSELYGTFTDASNYRRLYLSSTTDGAFTLGVEGLGTGASGNTLTLGSPISIPYTATGSDRYTITSFATSSREFGFFVDATGFQGGIKANSQLYIKAPSGVVVQSSPLIVDGAISRIAWTTGGARLQVSAATYTNTTSSGTVAIAYTDAFAGNTIAATSSTTFTDYVTSYFGNPNPGSNVTITNRWALGADSLRIGTSTPLTVSTTGALTASAATFSGTITGPSGGAEVNTLGLSLPSGGLVRWASGALGTSTDLLLLRDAANTLGQRNAGNAQRINLYETFTDSSNYTRAFFSANTTEFALGTESLGSGVARSFNIYTGGVRRFAISTTGAITAGIQTTQNADVTISGNSFTLQNGSSGSQTMLITSSNLGGGSFLDLTNTGASGQSWGFLVGGNNISGGGGVQLNEGNFLIRNAATAIAAFMKTSFDLRLTASAALSWGVTSPDLFLYRDAANTLGLRNGTVAQRINLYGTFTDTSNFRRLFLSSTTGGAFTLGVDGLGTGVSGNTLTIANAVAVSGSITATNVSGTNTGDRTSKTFTLTTRASTTPDFIGQVGFETDSTRTYRATGVSAGNWQLHGAPITGDFTRSSAPADATGGSGLWTWTVPDWCTSFQVELIGAGGGGGSGRRGANGTARFGGAGGGGGARTLLLFTSSTLTPSRVLTVEVGAGGLGGGAVSADDTNGFSGTNPVGTTIKIAGANIAIAANGTFGLGGTAVSQSNTGSLGGSVGTATGQVGAFASSIGQGTSLPANNLTNGCFGGAAGGGLSVSDTNAAGGTTNGTLSPRGSMPAHGGGTAGGGNGGNGVQTGISLMASSGSGGGSNNAGTGGNGGTGLFGSGGGGGGASANTFNSGAGGNGGDGFVRITCW